MISKELLSEVLENEVPYQVKVHKIIIKNNSLNYFYNSKDNRGGLFEANEYINIYELANKCKEWALDNSWIISTVPMLTEKKWRNTSVRLSHFYSAGKDRYLDGIYHNGRIEANTETEAIFKACEWIMENKCGS